VPNRRILVPADDSRPNLEISNGDRGFQLDTSWAPAHPQPDERPTVQFGLQAEIPGTAWDFDSSGGGI